MEVNENTLGQQSQLRSSYLRSITSEFNKAEARNRLHEETLKLAEKNYKGEMLQRLIQEENNQYSDDIGKVLQNISALTEQEINHLAALKKDEIANTSEKESGAIARIDKLADILTEEELQLLADEYKEFPLVQRKLSKVSDQRGFSIDTYPGTDKKLEIVQQIAADMKGYISSRDFGLTPGIYMQISFPEYDDILSPTVKKEAADDNA